ncbi:MAG: ATP-binding protein [Variovorax sp.]
MGALMIGVVFLTIEHVYARTSVESPATAVHVATAITASAFGACTSLVLIDLGTTSTLADELLFLASISCCLLYGMSARSQPSRVVFFLSGNAAALGLYFVIGANSDEQIFLRLLTLPAVSFLGTKLRRNPRKAAPTPRTSRPRASAQPSASPFWGGWSQIYHAASNISHDLRQPVHALLLLRQQLRDGARSDSRLIARIERASAHLGVAMRVVAQVEHFLRAAHSPPSEIVDVDKIVQTICGGVEPLALAKGLQLQVRATNTLAQCNEAILFSILSNIVSNAIKYTDAGHVEIAGRKRGASLELTVRDTGRGIPDEDRARICEDRFRGQNVGGVPGTGSGLAQVQRLCKLASIPLSINSELHCGTTVSIEVPIAGAAADATPAPPSVHAEQGFLLGKTIWLIEDDALIALAMSSLLESWGGRVTVASSPAEFPSLKGPQAEFPDLLISDYWIDVDVTGLEYIVKVRVAAGAKTPALLITGDASLEVCSRAALQDVAVMHKPCVPSALKRELRKLMLPGPPLLLRTEVRRHEISA